MDTPHFASLSADCRRPGLLTWEKIRKEVVPQIAVELRRVLLGIGCVGVEIHHVGAARFRLNVEMADESVLIAPMTNELAAAIRANEAGQTH